MATARGGGRGGNASAVGMMEGAFFVSRTELLQWVNNLLQINLTKVEQCASGAVYCQILDSCHQGTVAMKKVNWMAKSDHEFIPNYKLLQAAFDRNRIERHIDVDKLIRAKYQDNLEFMQWMKCHWEREGGPGIDYDAVAAREGRPVPQWARGAGGGASTSAPSSGPSSAGYSGGPRTGEKENLRPVAADAPKRAPAAVAVGGAARAPVRTPRSAGQAPAAGSPTERERELEAKLAAQLEELEDLRAHLGGLEKERDYYFRKLRDVEVYCTGNQPTPAPDVTPDGIFQHVLSILYAEDDEAGAQDGTEGQIDGHDHAA